MRVVSIGGCAVDLPCAREACDDSAVVAKRAVGVELSSGPMGLRYERGADFGGERCETQAVLLFPLESSVVDVAGDGASWRLDRSIFAVVGPRHTHRLVPLSAIAKVVTLFPGRETRSAVVREYAPHVDGRELDVFLSQSRTLPRTRWMDELIHRYLFERHVCEKHGTSAARFLETEIVKEVYFLSKEREKAEDRGSVLREARPTMQAAVAWIERHLFEPLKIGDLARHVHASESTLLRAFKRELGVTPAEFVRTRRLDEALLLLESGRYSVSEVALRVGYENPAAFSVVFRKRFGHPPSASRLSAGPPAPPPEASRNRRNRRRN